MWRALLPTIIGIIVAEYGTVSVSTVWIVVLTLASLAATVSFYLLTRRHSPQWWHGISFHTLLAIFFALAGIGLHTAHTPHYTLPTEHQHLRLLLRDTPQPTKQRLRTTAEVMAVEHDSTWHSHNGRLMLYLLKDSMAATLKAGDIIETRLFVRTPDSNYADRLRRHKILYIGFVGRNPYTVVGHRHSLSSVSQHIQQRLAETIANDNLTPQHLAVVRAMLLGQRDYTYQEQREQYSRAGIVHLLCVSGLHVGIIAYIVSLLLSPLGNRRRSKIIHGMAQLLTIWAFVFITGMAPATLRAGIMFSLYIVAQMTGREGNGINILCFTAFAMLVFNPLLLFDVGFQFSYAAMAGIFTLFPSLSALIQPAEHDGLRGIAATVGKEAWNLLCLTLAAQLFVMPIQLYYFHQMPTYFLVSNFLIVPFAGLLLATALAVILLAFWPWASSAAAWLLNGELTVIDGIVQRLTSLPYSTITTDHFNITMAALAYLALIILTLIIKSFQTPDNADERTPKT